ncbi:MAG: glycosyltransferase family 2 protein [Proteobacteria bacterium]|nr:glycosyltransferase family 2 protein [Pseudomonadota bacterium]
MSEKEPTDVSIIIPIYNEEDNVVPLFERLFAVLDTRSWRSEIVAVNDGSSDRTAERLDAIAGANPRLKIVHFRRNFGQTAALMAGIDHSAGQILVFIDADLQNDPADIPMLVDRLGEGYDVVSGWRVDRKDAAISRNFPSRVANWLISRIGGVPLHDYGCTLKAYRREVLGGARLYGEMHRFIPIYAAWMGAQVCEVPVRHAPRIHGTSKYGLERVLKVLLDLLVVKFLDSYLTKPIYVFGGFGLACITLSGIIGLTAVLLKIFKDIAFIQTPLLLMGAMTFLIGILSLLIGLLAEIMVRVYFESRGRVAYSVRRTLNVGDRD